MVKKIAVIALVAVIAVPILLGYAFNLTSSTVTDYDLKGDPVNVTPLLQNDTGYDNVHASLYDLNVVLRYGDVPVNPTYVEVGKNKSIFPLKQSFYTPDTSPLNQRWYLSEWADNFTYIQADYNGTAGYLQLQIEDNNTVLQLTVNNVHTIYYNEAEMNIQYSYYPNINDRNTIAYGYYNAGNDHFIMGVYTVGSNTLNTVAQLGRSTADTYVNLSKGFYFTGTPMQWYVKVPHYTHSILMTIDLDSITDSSYGMSILSLGRLYFVKSTTGGDVSWEFRYVDLNNNLIDSETIYYNQSGNNCYQLYIYYTDLGNDGADYNYREDISLKYVGKWPTLIGPANAYIEYDFTHDFTFNAELTTSSLTLNADHPITPIIRMDDAEYRGMGYPIIQNVTYSPNAFRANPSTTITDIQRYGTAIVFGGETFTVDKDGNITLGTRQVSLSKCVFKSVPYSGGFGYENRIGDTVISISPTPSSIYFEGRWSASVATDEMDLNTYTRTIWHAGTFGWDGMDQNFLMVGLLTSLGAFVALGIYARKSGSGGIIPLMIVTGCAAMVFFVML